jgi:hypothetical protein
MHNNTPQNVQEAVELGLYLAITANTEQKSAEALELAKGLAQELNYAEVQNAKRNVAAQIELERQTRRDLSDVISTISPAETPFAREAREMNVSLHDWEVAKAKYIPKPKRVTRDLILDAIGCPNLEMMRVKSENPPKSAPAYMKVAWRFVYLKEPGTNLTFLHYLATGKSFQDQVVAFLDVDQPRLKDLTLEQWVENGQMLVDQVENA